MELYSHHFSLGIHIIAMVSWMAALFLAGQLLTYHRKALSTADGAKPLTPEVRAALQKQYSFMERRLLSVIATPALMLTIAFGIELALRSNAFAQSWIHWKMMLVIALVGYHMYAVGIMLKLRRSQPVMSSRRLHLFIKLMGIMLFMGIILLAIYKQSPSALIVTFKNELIVLFWEENFSYHFMLVAHIITMVSWMAAIFCGGQLPVYHQKALSTTAGAEPLTPEVRAALQKQYSSMELNIFGVAISAFILTIISGLLIALTYKSNAFVQSWIYWKMMLIIILAVYHICIAGVMLEPHHPQPTSISRRLRRFNKVAPMLFTGIVFLAIFKQPLPALIATLIVIGVVTLSYRLVRLLSRRA